LGDSLSKRKRRITDKNTGKEENGRMFPLIRHPQLDTTLVDGDEV
jgi:hypothetical protein